jgi:hypothetical protein
LWQQLLTAEIAKNALRVFYTFQVFLRGFATGFSLNLEEGDGLENN